MIKEIIYGQRQSGKTTQVLNRMKKQKGSIYVTYPNFTSKLIKDNEDLKRRILTKRYTEYVKTYNEINPFTSKRENCYIEHHIWDTMELKDRKSLEQLYYIILIMDQLSPNGDGMIFTRMCYTQPKKVQKVLFQRDEKSQPIKVQVVQWIDDKHIIYKDGTRVGNAVRNSIFSWVQEIKEDYQYFPVEGSEYYSKHKVLLRNERGVLFQDKQGDDIYVRWAYKIKNNEYAISNAMPYEVYDKIRNQK